MLKKNRNMILGEIRATEKRVYFNPGSGFVFIEQIDGLGKARINRMKYRVAVFV